VTDVFVKFVKHVTQTENIRSKQKGLKTDT